MAEKPQRTLKSAISWAKNAEMIKGDSSTGASSAFFFRDGRIHVTPEGKFRVAKFTLDDVETVSLAAPSGQPVRVSSGKRAAGGAIAGGLLLGPAGLIAGAVVGNAAKRTVEGNHVLDIVLTDGTKYTLIIKPPSVSLATRLVDAMAAQVESVPLT